MKNFIFCLIALFILKSPASAEISEDSQAKARLVKLNELLAHDQNNSNLLRERGDIHYQMNEFSLAVQDYTAAITRNGQNDQAYFGRGMALGRMGKVDEGIADLTIYLDRHPDSSVAYTKRGVRHIWRENLQEAERDLMRAIELDPANAEAHDDLGVIHAKKGHIQQASLHFARAIELDPSYQKAYHNLAICHYLARQPEKALSIINSGLSLAPDEKSSLLLKSAILQALGNEKDAKEIADRAEFLPDGNWSERTGIK